MFAPSNKMKPMVCMTSTLVMISINNNLLNLLVLHRLNLLVLHRLNLLVLHRLNLLVLRRNLQATLYLNFIFEKKKKNPSFFFLFFCSMFVHFLFDCFFWGEKKNSISFSFSFNLQAKN